MTRSPFHVLVVLVLGALLGACSGIPVAEVQESLRSTPPCCRQWAELPFKPVVIEDRVKFSLADSSPVFVSSAGPAYVAAFTVPANAKTLSVQALNTEYLPKATFPDPLLVFLDRERRPIAERKDLSLQRSRHRIFPGVYEYYYGATVGLPPGTQYLVVFANPTSTRAYEAISDGGVLWKVPAAPAGTMAIIFR